MKKKIAIIIVVALIGCSVAFRLRHRTEQQGDQIQTYGTVEIRDAQLAFPEQERISLIFVDEGDRVHEGQKLAEQQHAKLDATIAQTQASMKAQEEKLRKLTNGTRPQEIAQAEAELAAAQIQLANGKKQYNRLRTTTSKGATPEQNLDDAKSNLAALQATLTVQEKKLNLLREGARTEDIATARYQLASLQASLKLLQIRRADMTLTAPSDGIIESRILEKGEIAGPQKPVFTLAIHGPKWIRAYLPEPDLGKIQQGMAATIQTDSFPETPFKGTVASLASVAEFTPRTVQTEELRTKLVYETRILVTDPEDRLRLGMPVTVFLDLHAEKQKETENSQPDNNTQETTDTTVAQDQK